MVNKPVRLLIASLLVPLFTTAVHSAENIEMMADMPAFTAGIAELMVNGSEYEGTFSDWRSSYTDRAFGGASCARGVLYTASVWPGKSYTLGLTYPAVNQKVSVTFYDRWPFSPGAKAYRLPSGPVVRTNPHLNRYYWQFDVSVRSTGIKLYMRIETIHLEGGSTSLPYSIFITSPPVSSKQLPGQGITFLQGPRNLVLTNERLPVVLTIKPPESTVPPQIPNLPIPGNQVGNGERE